MNDYNTFRQIKRILSRSISGLRNFNHMFYYDDYFPRIFWLSAIKKNQEPMTTKIKGKLPKEVVGL